MSFTFVTPQVTLARNAGALYNYGLGSASMSTLASSQDLVGLLNSAYATNVGSAATTQVAARLVANLGITGAAATAAEAFVVAQLNPVAVAGRGKVISDLLAQFSSLTSDATYGAAASAFNARVAAAVAYADRPWATDTTFAMAGQLSLSIYRDELQGSSGNDVFTARVVQNTLGEQTNELATGDMIVGGAGTDTLQATVQMASPLNNGTVSPIRPITRGVEVAEFTALEAVLDRETEVVHINAADMRGLTKVASVGSDASLTILNLTTAVDSGVYAARRNTSEMTVRMDHSGNSGDFNSDQESDFTVLFDQNYLRAGQTSTSSIELRVVNNLELRTNNQPLTGFDTIRFNVGSQAVDVPLQGVQTYAGVVTAITARLSALGITGVTVTQLANRPAVFTDDIGGFARGSEAGTYTPIEIRSSTATVAAGPISLLSNVTRFNGLNTWESSTVSANDPVTVNVELLKVGRGGDGGDLTIGGMNNTAANVWQAAGGSPGIAQFNVVVEGDATQVSDLASLQSTNNSLRTVNVTAAQGAAARLIIGNGETPEAAVNGALTTNTNDQTTFRNLGLKDVRVFNAANFPNGNELHAHVSDESVSKYMVRTDTASNPAADNANFVYSFGSGNDVFNLNISRGNLVASGTGTREDFTFSVDGGAGNDTIITQIGDGAGVVTDFWYINQTRQSNLSISGGAGSDTVRTYGAGAWSINLGDGADSVYTDNSGHNTTHAFNQGRSTWVLNSTDQATAGALAREVSSTAPSTTGTGNGLSSGNNASSNLYLGSVTLTFTDDVGGAFSSGAQPIATTGFTTSKLQINNAIKLAIQGSEVLSRLVVAEDGPANSLIVRSLIDGNNVNFSVSLARPTVDTMSYSQALDWAATQGSVVTTALTTIGSAGWATSGNGWITLYMADPTAAATYPDAQAPQNHAYNHGASSAPATVAGLNIAGIDSNNENANTVTGGAGNDVIILSTDSTSAETVVFSGSFDRDTLVNFGNAGGAAAGQDRLDFRSYLSNTATNAATGLASRIGTIGVDGQNGSATGSATFSPNNVVVVDFADILAAANAVVASTLPTTTTAANITDAQVLAALNVAGNYVTAATADATLTQAVAKAVLMIESTDTSGFYRVYEVSFSNTTAVEEFTAATLVGSINFGVGGTLPAATLALGTLAGGGLFV